MGAKQHRHEQDLGLIDAGGRFYDPLFGVFLSADPLSPLGGSSPRMNRYAYVGYDPVNFVDPSGLALRDVWNDIAHYAGQAWGVVFVGPVNALFTGRWETSWDDATTFGVFQGLFTAMAGFICGAAGGPALAIACVALASGHLNQARGGSFFKGAALGAASSLVGFGAGTLAGMGAQSLGASSTQVILSEAGSAYGANLGFQAIIGSDITWAGAIANGVASGLLAWHRVGQQDAATAQLVGQRSGEAAGTSSDLVAGITRTHSEIREALSQLAAMGSRPDLRVACFPLCDTVLNPFHDYPEGVIEAYLEGTKISASVILTGAVAELAAAARAAMLARGATPIILEQIAGGKSIQLAVQALNRSGATQIQTVQTLTQVVANSGRSLLQATVQGQPGTIALSGVQFVPGGLTKVVVVTANGVATYGSATTNLVSGALVVSNFIAN